MNFTCIKIKVIASWQQCAHLRKSLHLCIVFSCKYFCQNVLARNIILWFMVHVVSEKNNCITNQWKQSKCSSWVYTIKTELKLFRLKNANTLQLYKQKNKILNKILKVKLVYQGRCFNSFESLRLIPENISSEFTSCIFIK